MASTPHPMAAAFEKAVADKMNMRGGKKQSPPGKFANLGDRNMNAGGMSSAKTPKPFNLHPHNTKVLSAKRGTTR